VVVVRSVFYGLGCGSVVGFAIGMINDGIEAGYGFAVFGLVFGGIVGIVLMPLVVGLRHLIGSLPLQFVVGLAAGAVVLVLLALLDVDLRRGLTWFATPAAVASWLLLPVVLRPVEYRPLATVIPPRPHGTES
jgi:hypothetical protein